MELYWYDLPSDFVTAPAEIESLYSGSEGTDFCKVFGGWDAELKAKGDAHAGVKYTFRKPLVGVSTHDEPRPLSPAPPLPPRLVVLQSPTPDFI